MLKYLKREALYQFQLEMIHTPSTDHPHLSLLPSRGKEFRRSSDESYFKLKGALFALILIFSFWSGWLAEAADPVPTYKLDPVLKSFAVDGEARAAPGAMFPMVAGRYDPKVVSAIVKVSRNPRALESVGARVRTVAGDIVTVDVPLGSLADLARLPDVLYIQASRQMQPTLLDISVPATGADQVWESAPGYTGKGIIVGVIDTGIDWSHPAFKGKDGSSRILYIWDQTVGVSGRSPAIYEYGAEWTKDEIDSSRCQEIDAVSHGTHVASTAAGNEGDPEGFTGMAPEADIIVVKTSYGDAEILDGVDYIFSKASESGKPAVINMSFGNQWGPHDGTTLLDQALNNLVDRPGRVIVASAGNDGGAPVHVSTSNLRQSISGNYPWTAVIPDVGSESVAIQAWYNSAKPLGLRLLLPENDRGDLADLGSGWVSEGQSRIFLVPDGPLAGAEVIIDAEQPPPALSLSSFKGVYIHIYNNGDLTIPVDEYTYAIEYDGPGIALDAYIVWGGYFTTYLPSGVSFPSKSFLMDGDGNKTIISPSSASEVICVGSYVTRSEWVDSENRIRDENIKIDDISIFSSLGPLLNGAQKPDIAAPGEMVVAAFSADAWDRPKRIYRDGKHVSWRGTSMSAPHVAGAVALMFEQNPNLNASAIKYVLTRSSMDRGPTGWDKAWGYGKMNVLAAMNIPARPDGLRLTAGDGSVSLNWNENEEGNISGYRIYAYADGKYWMLDTGYWLTDDQAWMPNAARLFQGGSWIPDADCWMLTSVIRHQARGVEYEVSGVENDTSIAFSVSAYNNTGNEGQRSEEIIITPSPPGPDVTAPPPPGDLTAISVDAALDLTWSGEYVHDLSGYKIYYGTSSQNYDKVKRIGRATEYRLEGLINDTRVYVAVSSVDTSGNESEKSREVSAVPRRLTAPSLRYQGGWPESIGNDVYSSPTLYDIDGDGRLEVSISSRDGKVYILHHDSTPVIGWPISTGAASVSSPALGDLDGDGKVEVVIGAGEMVYAWHIDGKPMPGWPVRTGGSVLASPALGDIDGDGKMEVVIGSRDGNIYAYNADASEVHGWPVRTQGPVHSSAAIGDIDGDSRMEIVVGSEDRNLYVLEGDGTSLIGWPAYARSAIYSSPAIGDLDGDGDMEIVAADDRGLVYAWYANGEQVPGWPINLEDKIVSSPALGNIDDNNNTLEIVIGAENGSLYVLRNNGVTMDGWPVSVADELTSSPALGDINDDGKAEVIISTGTGYGYIGLLYAFSGTGKRLPGNWPAYTEGNICYSSPALGDLDGDGDVEVVVGSCRQADGTGGRVHAWDLPGRWSEEKGVWSGFRNDPQHTGVARDIVPPSFVIAVLQNAALKKYLNLYAIASEKLISAPEVVVEFTPNEASVAESLQTLSLIQSDIESRIYRADLNVEREGFYTFTISGTDVNGNTGHSSKGVTIKLQRDDPDLRQTTPANFSLLPNYPNPFNPGTWIPYELARAADVTIEIYSSAGILVRSLNLGRRAAGSYTSVDNAAYWDGKDDSLQETGSGVYFSVLKAGDFRAMRKMILVR